MSREMKAAIRAVLKYKLSRAEEQSIMESALTYGWKGLYGDNYFPEPNDDTWFWSRSVVDAGEFIRKSNV